MLDGVGHVAQMEVPRLVARAVVGLLAETGDGDAARRRIWQAERDVHVPALPTPSPVSSHGRGCRAGWSARVPRPSARRPRRPVARGRRPVVRRDVAGDRSGARRRAGHAGPAIGARGWPPTGVARTSAEARRRPTCRRWPVTPAWRRRRPVPDGAAVGATPPVLRLPGPVPRAGQRHASRYDDRAVRCWAGGQLRRYRVAVEVGADEDVAAFGTAVAAALAGPAAGSTAAGCGCSRWPGALRTTSRSTWPPPVRRAGCARQAGSTSGSAAGRTPRAGRPAR